MGLERDWAVVTQCSGVRRPDAACWGEGKGTVRPWFSAKLPAVRSRGSCGHRAHDALQHRHTGRHTLRHLPEDAASREVIRHHVIDLHPAVDRSGMEDDGVRREPLEGAPW